MLFKVFSLLRPSDLLSKIIFQIKSVLLGWYEVTYGQPGGECILSNLVPTFVTLLSHVLTNWEEFLLQALVGHRADSILDPVLLCSHSQAPDVPHTYSYSQIYISISSKWDGAVVRRFMGSLLTRSWETTEILKWNRENSLNWFVSLNCTRVLTGAVRSGEVWWGLEIFCKTIWLSQTERLRDRPHLLGQCWASADHPPHISPSNTLQAF